MVVATGRKEIRSPSIRHGQFGIFILDGRLSIGEGVGGSEVVTIDL